VGLILSGVSIVLINECGIRGSNFVRGVDCLMNYEENECRQLLKLTKV